MSLEAYGFGRAEGILAQFLRGRRDRVTVATKFGFQMPSGLAGDPRLIAAAKRLLGPFPALLRRAQRRGGLGDGGPRSCLPTSLQTPILTLVEARPREAKGSLGKGCARMLGAYARVFPFRIRI